ncbi:MAG: imidazoleglycerol-phosphate dehydratase HisB [Anaerolineae bacterium]|nr:MAG: imidazoleglycerol-phosphate dehydratase HisB [Anaerolineae bacterium]
MSGVRCQVPGVRETGAGGGRPSSVVRRLPATITRTTSETDIRLEVGLDGSGVHEIRTGLGFLDHMLTHVAVHGLFDVRVQASGDLHVDPHHTLEDVALALGAAFDQALGERKGIVRMGSAFVPMDETLAHVAVDFSGRPYCVFQAQWHAPAIGEIHNTLWAHFFQSFAVRARCTLHARVLYGGDDHHQAEALFKALGRALDAATRLDPRRSGRVPSTKGSL